MSDFIQMDWEHTALLIIDMQHDFAKKEGASYVDGTEEVISELKELTVFFRQMNLPIFHIVRMYKDDGSNAELCRKHLFKNGHRIVSPETKGAKILTDLLPYGSFDYDEQELLNGNLLPLSSSEFVLYKPRWGAFYNTGLDNFLSERNITSLVIAGCNFPNCPRTTIYEASERDYRISIIPEAMSRLYPRGIDELRGIGVNIYCLKELKSKI